MVLEDRIIAHAPTPSRRTITVAASQGKTTESAAFLLWLLMWMLGSLCQLYGLPSIAFFACSGSSRA